MIIALSVLFIFGYIVISAEHKLLISKSATAIVMGSTLWFLIAIQGGTNVAEHISEAGLEIFEIVIFLLSAMTLVEILTHYKFFDAVRLWVAAKKLTNVGLLWLLTGLSFALSAVIDNLTTTIIFSQLSRLFFRGKNLIVAVAAIVVAANAGGAFSPIGDVTTTMLWLKGKFTSSEIILNAFIPSVAIYLVGVSLIIRQATADECEPVELERFKLRRSEKLIIGLAFGSFSLPFAFHFVGLEPYMGLLTGLGITWLATDFLRRQLPEHPTHFTASIEKFLQNADIATLQFFVGILLAVSALEHLGVLAIVSDALFGDNPSMAQFIFGSSLMGMLSAVVDNVPLTAAATEIVQTTDASIWSLIALTLGTGGSVLLIGSAAGIVAMGLIKELNFVNYLKIATVPATLGYVAGIAMWYLQHLAF